MLTKVSSARLPTATTSSPFNWPSRDGTLALVAPDALAVVVHAGAAGHPTHLPVGQIDEGRRACPPRRQHRVRLPEPHLLQGKAVGR
ncbi:hypothetical protein [Luteococcus japonicus]|uniref:hypothetical protein n=1 Tax=Luteococcus japonicus TaxID=33984 RepID=UPI0011CD758E|nr:hypothetical protein [Luteococcus japonicus]